MDSIHSQERQDVYRGAVSSAQFVAEMEPPEYVVEGILQRGMVYAMTGKTGFGKSAISLLLASCVARGRKFARRRTQKGSVLYLASENPENVRWQWYGLETNAPGVFFHEGSFAISDSYDAIARDVRRNMPELTLVIADTLQSLFEADSDNDNIAMVQTARGYRLLTQLPTRPTVLVQCHPTKNPTRGTMVPRGGSAFLNEVDGNVALWRTGDVTTLYSLGKHRGVPYDDVSFKLELTYPGVEDQWGTPMGCTVASPISTKQAIELDCEDDREILALRAIAADLGITQKRLGETLGIELGAAQRLLIKLVKNGLIRKQGRKITGLTAIGKRLI